MMYKVIDRIIRVDRKAFLDFLYRKEGCFPVNDKEERIKYFLDGLDSRPEVLNIYSSHDLYYSEEQAMTAYRVLKLELNFEKDPEIEKKNYFEFHYLFCIEFEYELGVLRHWHCLAQCNELTGGK